MELFFDTETTGLALFKLPHSHERQPDIVQIGLVLSDAEKIYFKANMLVNPSGVNSAWNIGPDTQKIHGISNEMVKAGGTDTRTVLLVLDSLLAKANTVVCHNVEFDKKMVMSAAHKAKLATTVEDLAKKPAYCTMKNSTNLCKLPGPYGFKWPKLVELYKFLFNETFEGAHDALVDVLATRRCYYELVKRGK